MGRCKHTCMNTKYSYVSFYCFSFYRNINKLSKIKFIYVHDNSYGMGGLKGKKWVGQSVRKVGTYMVASHLKMFKDRLSNIFATCRTKVCNANKHCDLGLVCLCVSVRVYCLKQCM